MIVATTPFAMICFTFLLGFFFFFNLERMEEEMKNNTNGNIQLTPPEPNTNIPIKYPEIAPLILTDLNL